MNGRNFLDLALLVPGVSPTNIGSTQLFAETSAVPGAGPLGRQPAQLLEQLHRRRPVGQRRRGRAERHPVRRRRGRSVPGGDVGRAGRARPRARRLHQRRHQERHQRAARRPLRLLPRRPLQRARMRCSGTKLPMTQQQYGAQPRRPDRARSHVLLRERRAAAARSDRAWSRSRRRTSTAINARLAAVGYPGAPVTTGIYPNPVHSTNFLGKVDHQFSGARSAQRPLQPLRRRRRATRAAPAALNAPSASAALDNIDQTVAVSNTLDAVAARRSTKRARSSRTAT